MSFHHCSNNRLVTNRGSLGWGYLLLLKILYKGFLICSIGNNGTSAQSQAMERYSYNVQESQKRPGNPGAYRYILFQSQSYRRKKGE